MERIENFRRERISKKKGKMKNREGIKVNMILRERRMLEENKDFEERDDQRFRSISIGILLAKFVADILQNLFLIDLVIWKTVHSHTIADNIKGQR